MALFGFAINFKNGSTDYVIASAADAAKAESNALASAEDSGCEVESISPYDAEELLYDQYDDCAVLSTQFGGG